MKYYYFLWIAILFIACSNTSDSRQSQEEKTSALSPYFNKEWANNKLWYDGLAEVAIYDAQRTVYNKERNFEYTYITVAEDFNKEFRVKTDDYERKDLYKVMKVNAFCKIETENYPYHYLTSMFFNFKQPWAMDKMTNGSQEWCGNTFKEYLADGNHYTLKYHSYFDGEGDGEKALPANLLIEDQLNYTLRSLNFKASLKFGTKILESQISSKVGNLKVYDATISVEDGEKDIVGKKSWKVILKLDNDKTNTYYFDQAYPNILVKQQTWDNRNLILKKSSRYAYWKH
ncbi:MAG: hypothetical protein KKE39_07270 [Bacteroidetes bacterium]|nr:hypothetical protein [Bacteroidota bacterium]MBU1373323.1 hypothetical protein [Bacteroidota bacterium]MBU1484414.1 hypothetical protein [Bacteroidota bacterium]MBU1760214.1 hypothetical protein [Bacteroidota bacterium]MBU2268676.1 hypothetical protein [Bacteroidota bacterium]